MMWIPPVSEPLQAGAGFFVALIAFLAYGVRCLLGRNVVDSEEEAPSANGSRYPHGADRDEDSTRSS